MRSLSLILSSVLIVATALGECPTTFEGWVEWREKLSHRWAETINQGGNGIGNWALEQLSAIHDCRKENMNLFSKNLGLDVCWSALLDGLKTLSQFRGSDSTPPWKLGMNVSDGDYYARTSKFTAIPDDIQNNLGFLNAVNKLETLDAAYAEIARMNEARRKKGDGVIEFVRFQGNVPAANSGSRERLLLYIAGNPQKWFSVGMPNKDGTHTPQFSAIAIHADSHGNKSVYFKDHWRVSHPNRVSFEDVKEGKFGDSCWACHKSGLLALPPLSGVTEEDQKKIPHFNDTMISVGLVGNKVFYDPSKLGPGYGGYSGDEEDLEGLREQIFPFCIPTSEPTPVDAALITPFVPIDKKRIRKAMNCSQCHNGQQRARLTPPLSDSIERKIDSGVMPPGMNLSSREKSALKYCLRLEYSGVFRGLEKPVRGRLERYLLQKECHQQIENVPRPKPAHSNGDSEL